MTEENKNNPWADKMQRLPVPPVDENWKGMKDLLDKEMPVTKKDRRWLISVLLLLLLIGVCTCPGILRHDAGKQNMTAKKKSHGHQKPTQKSAQELTPSPAVPGTEKKQPVSAGKEEEGAGTASNPIRKEKQASNGNINAVQNRKKINANFRVRKHEADNAVNPSQLITHQRNAAKLPTVTNKKNEAADKKHIAKGNPEEQGKEPVPGNSVVNVNPPGKEVADTSGKAADSIISKHNLVALPPVEQVDSVHKTLRKKDSVMDKRGFTFGLGLNQFFPVGNQTKSNYSSQGTMGGVGDYIPVPEARYYFRTKLYLQAEIQINTPQFTSQPLASLESGANGAGGVREHAVYIQKLFYFNVPLSIHYSPIKNFYVAGGLEFASLTNAVALYRERTVTPSRPDSFITSKIQTLKGDTLFQRLRTNEWRFLADLNYQWKHITLGLRYNQAFNNFINYKVSSTQITQARNSSLQLYLRYMLLDKRKEKKMRK